MARMPAHAVARRIRELATLPTHRYLDPRCMMPNSNAAVEHLHHHRDGSLWAKGQMLDGQMHGYWEFFRKDGTRLRSGHFDRGTKTGEWTTYDATGAVYKVTRIKAK